VRSFHFPPSASQAALPFSFGEALGSVEEYCAQPAKNAMKSVDITFRMVDSPGVSCCSRYAIRGPPNQYDRIQNQRPNTVIPNALLITFARPDWAPHRRLRHKRRSIITIL
jgi:hypothetical protein